MTQQLTYNEIIKKAKKIKYNIENNQEIGDSPKWSYYFAKVVLNPRKPITVANFRIQDKITGNNMSRQIKKADYVDMAKRFTKYVEYNRRLPNNIKVRDKLMRVSDYTYMFSWICVFFDVKGRLPSIAPVNSKLFIKPTEPSNVVYDLWVKEFDFKPKYIDDVCDYIRDNFTYEFYFDDQKSNAEVIRSKAGNCTDLSQMVVNMGVALGYDWKTYHVQCNQSGTGHIYPLFRKDNVNGGDYFVRDVACISDEGRYCVWCEAGDGGSLLAVNPDWFLQNLNR